MKKLIILFSLIAVVSFGQIKVNIGLDTLTNTKMKAELTGMSFTSNGALDHVTYIVRKYALDNTTLANAYGSETKRDLLSAKEYNFQVNGKYINTSTKVILSDTLGVTPKAKLSDYLRLKALNSYPGVSNGDPAWEFIEGILREIIAIKQASKQLPQ